MISRIALLIALPLAGAIWTVANSAPTRIDAPGNPGFKLAFEAPVLMEYNNATEDSIAKERQVHTPVLVCARVP